MFGRFLKPRWQHANPDIRLKAIEQLSAEQDDAVLAQLARGDANALVRAAATGRVTDFSLLDEIHQRDEAPSVRQAASMRIMALLAGTTDDAPNQETRLRLIRLTDNSEVLAFIAANSPDEICQQAAIERLDDDEQLFQLAVESRTEALRVSAAQGIHNLTVLKRLAREGRDKRVTRLARDQAKALQEKKQQEQAESAKVIHLADRLEQHAKRSVDALYGPRLEQLEQQWQDTSNKASPELAERVQRALQQCRNQLSAVQEEARRQALADTARAEREAAAHSLYQLLTQSTSETWDQQLGELRSALATQQRRWQSANEQAPAPEEEQRAFSDLTAAFERMLMLAGDAADARDYPDRLKELASQWPAEYPRPSVLMSVDNSPASDQAEPAAAKASHSTPHKGLLVALKRELRQGNLRHANRLWHKAQAIITEENDRHLANQLARLEPRRAELQDWHRFAAEPKKASLCEQMEALADSTMDAPQLASAIQALHDEWRSLMSSDQDEDQALWDRFKAATDKAYEPCRAHFAELDAQRQANLEKRRELCEQLEAFIAKQNWDQADWHGVWQIRQQAPKDWKQLQPVRFTDGREVQKQFSALLRTLDEKLADYVTDTKAARERLVDQARDLQNLEDVESAARLARDLQRQWRDAPWLPPAEHRGQQKAFRKAMDSIFKARDRKSEERKAQQDAVAEKVEAAMTHLESCLNAPFSEDSASQLRDAVGQLDEACEEGPLPRQLNRQVQQLRRRANERLSHQGEWQQWQQLRQTLQALPVAEECDEAALNLAVAFEALAGVPSPEEERQRRLQWQLETLSSAMKQHNFSALDEMRKLLAGHEAPICPVARQRMETAMTVLEPGNA